MPDSTACALATEAQRALQSGNTDRLVNAFRTTEVTCSPPGAGADPAAQLCAGRAAGEKVSGYRIGMRASSGQVVSKGVLVQFLSKFALNAPVAAQDDYGNAFVRLFTIGNPGRPGCTDNCLVLVYSYIDRLQPGADRFTRRVMTFDIDNSTGAWGVTAVLDGFLFPTEIPALLAGGAFDNRTYRPWNPTDGTKPAISGAPAAGGPFAMGQTVKVAATSGPCANRLSAPTQAAAPVECTPSGTPVQVENTATDGGGVHWWLARPIAPGSAAGWIRADQLIPS